MLTQEQITAMRALYEKVELGQIAYRPRKWDDWGFIRRLSDMTCVARSRHFGPLSDPEIEAIRKLGEDPCEPMGQLIVAILNALPALLDMAERTVKAEVERDISDTRYVTIMEQTDKLILPYEASEAECDALQARITDLERQRDDLQEANNRYLERARNAEAAS